MSLLYNEKTVTMQIFVDLSCYMVLTLCAIDCAGGILLLGEPFNNLDGWPEGARSEACFVRLCGVSPE